MSKAPFWVATALCSLVLTGSLLPPLALKAEEPGKNGAKGKAALARLLTFDDLEKRLKDPVLRLLDCRPRAEYDKSHIPGAVWIDTKALESQAGKPGGLEDRSFWEEWGATLGIAPGTEVFVYDAKRQLDAARVWFFLRWIGVEHVGLIDGGFPLWAKQGRPVSGDAPQIEPRPIAVKFRRDVAASRDEVMAALKDKSSSVLDARTDEEFAGTVKRSKRGGHIPSACHLEWTNLVGEDGKFLDRDSLRTKVEKAGIKPGAAVITHCQGGGRASVNAFVLELLGFRARNYYLGWSDWGNAADTPAEEGDKSREK